MPCIHVFLQIDCIAQLQSVNRVSTTALSAAPMFLSSWVHFLAQISQKVHVCVCAYAWGGCRVFNQLNHLLSAVVKWQLKTDIFTENLWEIVKQLDWRLSLLSSETAAMG
jgi:hypothetical protein